PDSARGFASARYRLAGTATAFEAKVAINDGSSFPPRGVYFEVFGDGKPLWKSLLVKRDTGPEECVVDVTGVDILELRVTAEGNEKEALAVWVDPFVWRGTNEPLPPPESLKGLVKKIPWQGNKVYLSDLEGFDVRSGPMPVSFNGQLGNGKDRIKVNGVLAPKGIGMHPPEAPAYAAIKYRLNKEAVVFKTVVAINDTSNWCWSPATFTVLGNGKVLWKSQDISHTQLRSQE